MDYVVKEGVDELLEGFKFGGLCGWFARGIIHGQK
jgi:hypothetical protein